MLRRSADDLVTLCAAGVKVRLVKGAYKEPTSIAYQGRNVIRDRYLADAEYLLTHGIYPAIATHDTVIIEQVQQAVQALGRKPEDFEFQMLYGIRRDLQARLHKDGYRLRIYIPYGSSWIPYVLRRVRERKENFWFVVSNLFHG